MPEYLHIFVNSREFDATDGVKEFMNGGEIAELAGISQTRAVVHLEAGIGFKDVRIDTFCPTPPHKEVQQFRGRHHASSERLGRQRNHKSQAKNRAEAMSGLRALYESGQARQRIGIREEMHIQSENWFSVTSM